MYRRIAAFQTQTLIAQVGYIVNRHVARRRVPREMEQDIFHGRLGYLEVGQADRAR